MPPEPVAIVDDRGFSSTNYDPTTSSARCLERDVDVVALPTSVCGVCLFVCVCVCHQFTVRRLIEKKYEKAEVEL